MTDGGTTLVINHTSVSLLPLQLRQPTMWFRPGLEAACFRQVRVEGVIDVLLPFTSPIYKSPTLFLFIDTFERTALHASIVSWCFLCQGLRGSRSTGRPSMLESEAWFCGSPLIPLGWWWLVCRWWMWISDTFRVSIARKEVNTFN